MLSWLFYHRTSNCKNNFCCHSRPDRESRNLLPNILWNITLKRGLLPNSSSSFSLSEARWSVVYVLISNSSSFVIPAKAGIQAIKFRRRLPGFHPSSLQAGMTKFIWFPNYKIIKLIVKWKIVKWKIIFRPVLAGEKVMHPVYKLWITCVTQNKFPAIVNIIKIGC